MAMTKEQLQKKSLTEIEELIYSCKQLIAAEKNLMTLGQLNSELSVMQEIRDQKLNASGRNKRISFNPSEKKDLKSYDDYLKSKKK